LIRETLPHMRERGYGRIVNLTSSSIQQPIDGLLLSNVFRVGVLGLSKSLSGELASDGILVNTLGPGRIHTDRVDSLDQGRADREGTTREEVRRKSEATIPLGRYGEPQEFAQVAAFLASPANTYVTGQALLADGGMVKAL
jgi:3-oxoacyl-[acyl-carrier protein] reductase